MTATRGLPGVDLAHNFFLELEVRRDRFLLEFRGDEAQEFFAQDAVLTADLVCADDALLKKAFDRTLAYLEECLSFVRGVYRLRADLFLVHKGIIAKCQKVSNRTTHFFWHAVGVI